LMTSKNFQAQLLSLNISSKSLSQVLHMFRSSNDDFCHHLQLMNSS